MSQEFVKLQSLLKRSHNALYNAYSHFLVWDSMKRLMAGNVSGETEAAENVVTINRFKNFFLPSLEANRKIFAIELAKVFDSNKKSLSLRKIINYARSNKKKLTSADFKEFNEKREHVDSLAVGYVGITEDLLKQCEKKLIELDAVIRKLKKFRNTKLAHDQIAETDTILTVEEAEMLFERSGEILNLLSSALNHESWAHLHEKDWTQHHTKSVIDYLRKYEPYRLKEIDSLARFADAGKTINMADSPQLNR